VLRAPPAREHRPDPGHVPAVHCAARHH
jgi:hypothetical protein